MLEPYRGNRSFEPSRNIAKIYEQCSGNIALYFVNMYDMS